MSIELKYRQHCEKLKYMLAKKRLSVRKWKCEEKVMKAERKRKASD